MDPSTVCPACLEPVPTASIIYYNDDTDSVCVECAKDTIVPLFHKALESEYQYGELSVMRLNANDFVSLLGAEFVARLDRLSEEYTTIGKGKRVYCPHVIVSSTAPLRGATTETTLALTHEELAAANTRGTAIQPCGAMACARLANTMNISCYHCGGMLCGRCGMTEPHSSVQDCTPSLDKDADPLAGMTLRGQKCPTCSIFWEQQDGCNHGICRYDGTNFCFNCGKEATDESGHWTMPSSCPRWPPSADDAVPRFDGSPTEFDERGLPVARLILDADPHRVFINATDFVRAFQTALQRRFNMPLPSWVRRLPADVEFVADVSPDGLTGHYVGLVAFSEQTTEAAAEIELLDSQVRAWFDSPAVYGDDVSGEDALVVFVHYAWTNNFLVNVDTYGYPIEDSSEDSEDSENSEDSEDSEEIGSDEWETIDDSDLDDFEVFGEDDSDDWEDIDDPELDDFEDSIEPDHSNSSYILNSRETTSDTNGPDNADDEDQELPSRCTGQ